MRLPRLSLTRKRVIITGGDLLIGVQEVVLISIIVLIVFGPDKLPEVARMLGNATREFRKITATAQRTWDEVGREIELQEARAKAALEVQRDVSGQTTATEAKKEAGEAQDYPQEPGTADNGSGEKQTDDAERQAASAIAGADAATDGNSVTNGDSVGDDNSGADGKYSIAGGGSIPGADSDRLRILS
jgi:TatA/E family protein of Tat protein translocase